jgi:hypothetical protein
VNGGDTVTPSSIPTYSANKRLALVVGPTKQFGKLVVVDDKLGMAGGADDRLATVPTGFAPFEDAANRMATPLAEVLENGKDNRAERLHSQIVETR